MLTLQLSILRATVASGARVTPGMHVCFELEHRLNYNDRCINTAEYSGMNTRQEQPVSMTHPLAQQTPVFLNLLWIWTRLHDGQSI